MLFVLPVFYLKGKILQDYMGYLESHNDMVYQEVFYSQYNQKLLADLKNTVTNYLFRL